METLSSFLFSKSGIGMETLSSFLFAWEIAEAIYHQKEIIEFIT